MRERDEDHKGRLMSALEFLSVLVLYSIHVSYVYNVYTYTTRSNTEDEADVPSPTSPRGAGERSGYLEGDICDSEEVGGLGYPSRITGRNTAFYQARALWFSTVVSLRLWGWRS